MMTLMNIDFSIRILIQSVVRNDDAMLNVVSDNQNGRENDQRRNHDIDTQKPTPFAATKSLFFYIIFFLLLLVVEALEHLRRLFLVSGERRVRCFSPNEGHFKFRVAY